LDENLEEGEAYVDQLGANFGPAGGCDAGEEAQCKVLGPLGNVVTEKQFLRLRNDDGI